MRVPSGEGAPLALWELARRTPVGGTVEFDLPPLGPTEVADLVEGGAFEAVDVGAGTRGVHVVARRRRSLADTVAPGMGFSSAASTRVSVPPTPVSLSPGPATGSGGRPAPLASSPPRWTRCVPSWPTRSA